MKIFVSYSRRDAGDFANQIHRHLSTFNYNIFTDVDDIRVGEIWSNIIEQNISNCDIFVVIVTHGSLQSPHVEKEVLQAQKENKTIIPCFHNDVIDRNIKWRLDKIQGVEFSDKYELARDLYSKIRNFMNKVNEKLSFVSQQKTIQDTDISDDVYALNEKGLAFFNQHEYQEAIECYDKALEMDPSNVYVLYNKGIILHDQGKYQEAIEHYDKALAVYPNYTPVLYNKGNALFKQGKYKEAIKYFDKVLAIDRNNTLSQRDKQKALRLLNNKRLFAFRNLDVLDWRNIK